MAQQSDDQVTAAVPMPDTALLPPLTAKDIEPTAAPATRGRQEPSRTPLNRPRSSRSRKPPTPAAEPAKVEPTKAAERTGRDAGVRHRGQRGRRSAARHDLRQARPHRQPQGRPRGRRSVLQGARLRAAVGQRWRRRRRAPRPRSPISRRSTASASTRTTIRRRISNRRSTAEALAEDELKLTASVLTYARQAQIGRIHFTRVGADIQFDLVAPEPAKVLAKLADGNDAGKALDSYNPPQAEFKALRAKLAELRKGGSVDAKAEEEKPSRPRACRRRQDPASRHEGCARGRAAQAPRHRRRQGQSALRRRRARRGEDVPDRSRHRRRRQSRLQHACARSTARRRTRAARRPIRSTPSSSTWSAGAGCRAISAIRT